MILSKTTLSQIQELSKLLSNPDNKLGVSWNHPEITIRCSLFSKLLVDENFVLVSGTSKTVGSPFTIIDPADPNEKSLLDLDIISRSLTNYIKELYIDNSLLYPMRERTARKQITWISWIWIYSWEVRY